jgi:hypothetical protein
MRKRELELENQTLKRELGWAKLKIQSLLEELRKKRIEQLGPRSETLSDLQLELLLDQEPGTSRDEVEAEAKREPIANVPSRERNPHPGRQHLPEKLERIEEVIPCSSHDRPLRRRDDTIALDEVERIAY